MTMVNTTVWEVQTDGDDGNGGGYDSAAGGSSEDYTHGPDQQTIKWAASGGDVTNDLASTELSGWEEVTSSRNFIDEDVGNVINIEGGTNFDPARYQIVSVAGGVATIDKPCSTATGNDASSGNGILGGALDSPGKLGEVLEDEGVSGMNAWMRAGTYTLGSATPNVILGAIDLTTTMANKAFTLRGYESTRDNLGGAKPVIAAGVVDPTQVIKMGGNSSNSQYIKRLDIDCDNRAIKGLDTASVFYNFAYDMTISNCDGDSAFRKVSTVLCKAVASVADGFDQCKCVDCLADTCAIGYLSTDARNCIAANCTVDGYEGDSVQWTNCVSYNSTTDGFSAKLAARGLVLVNCVSFGDGRYAFNKMNQSILFNCAHDADTPSGRFNGDSWDDIGGITLGVDPFTNAAGGIFSLNDEATGGALLRAAGLSPFGQTGFPDVGAVQHEDAGGGGGGGGSCSIIGG